MNHQKTNDSEYQKDQIKDNSKSPAPMVSDQKLQEVNKEFRNLISANSAEHTRRESVSLLSVLCYAIISTNLKIVF